MRGTSFRVLLLALFLTACGGDGETGSGSEGGTASPAAEAPAEGPGPECVKTDKLTAANNEWDPSCIVTSGSLTIANDDEIPHNFTITGVIEEPLEGGATIEVDVSEAAEAEGETFFVCTIHPGMDGFLWVQ